MATATSTEVSAFKSQISQDVANRAITIGTFNINQYVNQWTVPVHTAIRECMKKGIFVLGLQEYCEFTNFYTTKEALPGTAVSGGDTVTKITNVYDYVGKVFDQTLTWGGGKAGNAIASQTGFQQAITSGLYSAVLPSGGKCSWVKAVVNTAYKNVSVYCTHFSAKGPGEVRPHAEELANIFKADTNYYKVIVGDFNSWNGSGELDSLLTGCGLVPVFPMTTGRLDNILAPSYMTVLEKTQIEASAINSAAGITVCDHPLCYATLQFN